jgi:tetratricopeptide (TPR) repeat protein
LTVGERVLRAQIAQDQGRLADALAALDDPQSPDPQQGRDAALLSAWRGWIEMDRHHFRTAEVHLKRAVSLEPGRAQARRQLIDLYALQGRPAELAEQAHALDRLETLDFAYLYAWTLSQREGTDLAGQAAMLEDAVVADPNDRTSRLALAECLRKLGRLDQADAALEGLPDGDLDTCLIRARLALDHGNAVAAESLLDSPTALSGHPELAAFRGRLALLRGDAAVALQSFQAAVKALPEGRDVQFGLSQALRLAGQAKAAEPYLKAARDRDHLAWLVRGARGPGSRANPLVLQQIGTACREVGRRDLARAWYRLALSLDPGNTTIQSALDGIEAGGGA